MKTKVLHYAAGRDDRIVATYKDVTFIDRQVGWYVEARDERHERWDDIAIIERIDGVCFVAEFLSRNAAFDREHLAAVAAEARNLRAAMQERIARKLWIPLPYVAAYEALGWDARPLKEHRTWMRERQETESRQRRRLHDEREEQRRQARDRERQQTLQRAEEAFRKGEFIRAEHFVDLCDRYGIEIHPRTRGMLRRRIEALSPTHIRYSGGYGNRSPSCNGCTMLIDRLVEKLNV